MKHKLSVLTFLLCLVLITGAYVKAEAAGTVTYVDGADGFIFSPGSEQSPTDLFDSFKNVMPGDTLTQQIVIKNDPDGGVKVKVYLRSLGAQERTDEFLSQLTMIVKQADESILFSAPADEPAQLNDWVYLGTAYAGAEITLDVILSVPLSLGDEFQKQIGYIDWEFKVEEIPSEPSDPQPPQGSVDTGDSNEWGVYVGLMAVSLSVMLILFFAYKKRKKSAKNG